MLEPEFFETLSKAEAHAFMQRFLEVEALKFKKTARKLSAAGLRVDFSIRSISPLMRWVLGKLTSVRQEADPTVPVWIRNTASYTTRLFDFDDRSNELVMQAAYYLGESFVRSHSSLHWGISDIRFYQGNMPAVLGFENGMELTPICISNNLLRRVTAEPKKIGDFQIAVKTWYSYV